MLTHAIQFLTTENANSYCRNRQFVGRDGSIGASGSDWCSDVLSAGPTRLQPLYRSLTVAWGRLGNDRENISACSSAGHTHAFVALYYPRVDGYAYEGRAGGDPRLNPILRALC